MAKWQDVGSVCFNFKRQALQIRLRNKCTNINLPEPIIAKQRNVHKRAENSRGPIDDYS
jgi:hypothetical protein